MGVSRMLKTQGQKQQFGQRDCIAKYWALFFCFFFQTLLWHLRGKAWRSMMRIQATLYWCGNKFQWVRTNKKNKFAGIWLRILQACCLNKSSSSHSRSTVCDRLKKPHDWLCCLVEKRLHLQFRFAASVYISVLMSRAKVFQNKSVWGSACRTRRRTSAPLWPIIQLLNLEIPSAIFVALSP